MDRYLMYLRKSRADRDYLDEPVEATLSRHRARLEELCKSRKIVVEQVLSEVVSADSIAGRPQMMRLLSLVETGDYTGVVCVDMDRLSRGSGADQALVINTFKYSNTKIITPLKDYDFTNETDEQFAELGLFLGRSEYRMIRRRMMQGRIDATKEGKYVSGCAPYGYKTYKLCRQKGYSLEIIPEQADIVRKIFSLYVTENIGANAIAARLNQQGLRNQNGAIWKPNTITKILNDPTYTGKVRFREQMKKKEMRDGTVVSTHRRHPEEMIIADGLHEPIISQELFDAAQDEKKRHRTPHIRIDRTLHNPFCSLIICDQCGKNLVYRKEQGVTAAFLRCNTPGCPTKNVRADILEDRVLEALEDWLQGYVVKPPKDNRLPGLLKEKEKVLSDLKAEEKRLDKISDLLEQGVYTVEDYTRRRDKTEKRTRTLSERLEELEKEIVDLQAYEASANAFSPRLRTIVEQYRSLGTAKEKNLLLKSVIHHIDYHKLAGGQKHRHDFDLTIYPLLPKLP